MKELFINQYKDFFDFGDQGFIVDYILPKIEKVSLATPCKVIKVFSKELDKKVRDFEAFLEQREPCGQGKAVFTIIPSYNCNMLCTYCFEGRQPPVKPFCYERIAEFVKLVKDKYAITSCEIILLGGEPIIAEHIPIFAKYIGEIRKELPIEEVTCITNGLEVKNLFQQINELGITKYQVTLDGAEKTHNSRRPAKDQNINSFEQICSTIDYLLSKDCDVEVRVNFDEENIDDISIIVDIIFQRRWYKKGKKFRAYAYPVSENGVCSNMCYGEESVLFEKLMNEVWKLPRIKRIISVRVHGVDFIDAVWNSKATSPITKFCGANSDQFVFTPDGSVYPCWWGHSNLNDQIGRYDTVSLYEDKIIPWRNRSVLSISKCHNCKYRFICGGGCSYKAEKLSDGHCADFYNIFKIYLRGKVSDG